MPGFDLEIFKASPARGGKLKFLMATPASYSSDSAPLPVIPKQGEINGFRRQSLKGNFHHGTAAQSQRYLFGEALAVASTDRGIARRKPPGKSAR